MFKNFPIRGRTLGLLLGLIPLVALFVFVVFRAGPLASTAVTVVGVEKKTISPAIFGVGTVEARRTYKIGPVAAGRLMSLDVDVGDRVLAGQVIAEMDPVDLDDKVRAQSAVLKQAEAQRLETSTRQQYAKAQAKRYEMLLAVKSTSEENYTTKKHEYQLSEANLSASEQTYARAQSDYAALVAQRNNLKLRAPIDGIVSLRKADPGTTIVAGQVAVEIIDPANLWINARFDQANANGLRVDLPASVMLRSDRSQAMEGRIARLEPMADPVTEEMSVKISFDRTLKQIPPVGELAEITVTLPTLDSVPVLPNASIKRLNGKMGVWQIENGNVSFAPVILGASDLDGFIHVLDGLSPNAQVVVYSEQALTTKSRINIVKNIAGATK